MMPLFDMMAQAQNGKLLEAYSSQMGLAQEQMTKALAALMPAFSSGLKRSASDPANFTSMMTALAGGNYAKYFEDFNAAFTPQGIADGNAFMSQIFGSNEAARAVAEQAAKVTGVGQQALASMMPALASTMAGGLFKQMSGQMPSFDNASNPMMGMMNTWLEATGFKPQAKAATPNLFDNPFTQTMQNMFTGRQQEKNAADPFGAMAFMKAMETMMAGNPPKPKEEPKAADLSQYTEMFNTMFDSGLEVQKSYQKSMEDILDTYLKSDAEDKKD